MSRLDNYWLKLAHLVTRVSCIYPTWGWLSQSARVVQRPCKGPSINVIIFMSVQILHFRGGRGEICENQNIFCTLLTFWSDFYYFHGIFGTQQMLMCTLFGGGGSQKVYSLYTHEHVDIYGRPLTFQESYLCMAIYIPLSTPSITTVQHYSLRPLLL